MKRAPDQIEIEFIHHASVEGQHIMNIVYLHGFNSAAKPLGDKVEALSQLGRVFAFHHHDLWNDHPRALFQ